MLFIASQGIGLVTAGIMAYFKLNDKLTFKSEILSESIFKLSERVVRIEAMISYAGEHAAKLMHSPTDHHKLDKLLDKVISKDHVLSQEELDQLTVTSKHIMENPDTSGPEKIVATTLHAICFFYGDYLTGNKTSETIRPKI